MALTGMQIYKLLPKTNCKDCGFPTCMAFAMQVAAKQKALTDCPHLSDEAKAALSEASAPPMKLVKIGPDGGGTPGTGSPAGIGGPPGTGGPGTGSPLGTPQFQIGQETVMFRHEEKFHRPCGIAVRIPAKLSDADVDARVQAINKAMFIRVGQTLKVELAAVELDGVSDPAGRAKKVAEKSQVPLILMGKDAGAMKSACEAIKSRRPLIYRADSGTIDAFADIAASAKLPLAVYGKSLEELADSTKKAKDKGVEDILLSFDTDKPGDTLRFLTTARRAALRKNFRAFGFPAIVDVKSDSPEYEAIAASAFAAKYAGIVIVNSLEPWVLLPIMTTVQNIYTDPQVPNAVEAKLHEVGNVNENSPVMFTTNFSLTYFSVESEVERSKIPAYICVVDTEGLGVLNSYAGDKISAEKVVKTLKDQKVAEKVKHRKLIIPGLLPVFRAEIEDTSEWKEVIIGPESAREIPGFLTSTWK